ncbi:MAG: hypothetical protein H7330_14415 [Hymenobacteraceae bacterium]|nr:hypothetical protein [Hymenobacteraceae bacterium]
MFDSPQPFRFVQRNRPRPGGPVYRWAYVYAFFARSAHGRRKYVAEVHEYADGLFTMDFYAKLSSQSQNKYRVATNQFAMGRIGATLLAILGPFMASRPDACLGVLGASLVGKTKAG